MCETRKCGKCVGDTLRHYTVYQCPCWFLAVVLDGQGFQEGAWECQKVCRGCFSFGVPPCIWQENFLAMQVNNEWPSLGICSARYLLLRKFALACTIACFWANLHWRCAKIPHKHSWSQRESQNARVLEVSMLQRQNRGIATLLIRYIPNIIIPNID